MYAIIQVRNQISDTLVVFTRFATHWHQNKNVEIDLKDEIGLPLRAMVTSLSYLRVLVTSSTFLDTRSSSCFLALMADSKSRSSAVLVDTSLKSGWRADFVLAKIIVLICMMIDGVYTVNGTRGVDNGYVINVSPMVMMILKKMISTHCVIFSSASFIESTFSSRSILSDSSFTIAAFNRKVVSSSRWHCCNFLSVS